MFGCYSTQLNLIVKRVAKNCLWVPGISRTREQLRPAGEGNIRVREIFGSGKYSVGSNKRGGRRGGGETAAVVAGGEPGEGGVDATRSRPRLCAKRPRRAPRAQRSPTYSYRQTATDQQHQSAYTAEQYTSSPEVLRGEDPTTPNGVCMHHEGHGAPNTGRSMCGPFGQTRSPGHLESASR